jgi:hypothetical protein
MGTLATTGITFKQLHHQAAPNIGLRAWQVKVKKITGAYDGNAIATPDQINALLSAGAKRIHTIHTASTKAAKVSYSHRQQPEPQAVPAEPLEATKVQPEVQPELKHEAQQPEQYQSYQPYEPEPLNWQLWAVLVFSLGCSVPNMYSVALQMKDSAFLAMAITATFTISPMLLLSSDNRTARIAAFIPIAIEVFANTAGYYGNLLSITVGSDIITPGKFLNMVMQMAGTSARGTALFLALMMAAAIAAMSVVSVHSIIKKA